MVRCTVVCGVIHTEAEVVAGRGDGHAHEVAVLVHGLDDGGHDHGEDLRRARLLRELTPMLRARRHIEV